MVATNKNKSRNTKSVKKKKSQPSSRKRKTTTPKRKTLKEKFWRLLGLITGISLLLAGLLFYSIYLGLWGRMPDYQTLKSIQNSTASEIYTQDGVLMGRIYTENRTEVSFNKISSHAINALIATEDVRFYKHNGIDQIGLLRVLVKTILLGDRSSGGGSTLSQQLAKNLYPRKNYGSLSMIINKIQEAIIASRLENIYTKKDILSLYLNTVPFGERVFGIESASRRFFSISASQLKIEQAAVLVGMLKAPSYYNPRVHHDRSLKRRNTVLNQMSKYEFITQEKASKLKKSPLILKYKRNSINNGLAPYLQERIRLDVQKWLKNNPREDGSKYNLYSDGLRIYTTINSHMQHHAENAINEHMSSLQKTFYNHWGNLPPWKNNEDVINRAIKRSQRYKQLKNQGLSEHEIQKVFEKPLNMRIFTWKGEKQVTMTPLDSIKHYQKILNAGFMAMDPKSGKILSWVGGIDFKYFKFDHVMAKRQVGSVFKPLVYATALENGSKPSSYYPNEKKIYTNFQDWSPRNADNKYGGKYSMEGALTESVNTIAVDLLMQTGIKKVIKQANSMGIKSHLPQVPSIALGTADISLFEMLQTYACIANEGINVTPYYLMRIEDNKGNVIKNFTPDQTDSNPTMSPENARILTHMLKSVINQGTGKSLRTVYGLKNDIAGKTGTTQSHADGWFIGYTPDIVAGAWVGAEDIRVHFRTLKYGQGAYMALPIFGKFFSKINQEYHLNKNTQAYFNKPTPETLAQMNIPHYIPPNTNLFDKIFNKNHLKSENNTPNRHNHNDHMKRKRSIYERIRNIFKK